jgi:hyaluronan synthase
MTKQKALRLQELLYYGLVGILIVSALVFLTHIGNPSFWRSFSRSYFLFLLIYVWITFILLFIAEQRGEIFPKYQGETIGVIMPCFNESEEILSQSVESIIKAQGNKRIVIVDDGSTDQACRVYLKTLSIKHPEVTVHFFESNRGKRQAFYYAIKKLIGDVRYVVTIDSDTVLEPDALVKVVEPLAQPEVGASTGDIRLLNEHANLLTRMIAAYYWVGLNVYKRAQSGIGSVACCSGCLAAYRVDVINRVIDGFFYQTFFGQRTTHSEDRHLTNLVLEQGLAVKYVPNAISYTDSPSTIKGFLKQQQRWKRGYIRESLYTLTFAWKTKPVLFGQILFWDLTVPFVEFGLMMMLWLGILIHPTGFFLTTLPIWLAFMMVRYLPIMIDAKDKVPGLVMYLIVYPLLYWQTIYALFKVKDSGWITRKTAIKTAIQLG